MATWRRRVARIAIAKAGLAEMPHVTRSPTVAGSALAAGIMQCAAWAGIGWALNDHQRSPGPDDVAVAPLREATRVRLALELVHKPTDGQNDTEETEHDDY